MTVQSSRRVEGPDQAAHPARRVRGRRVTAVERARLDLPRRRYEPDARGPLSGVRVLDLTRLVSGAQFGLVLGDLGADVVKVERPGAATLRHTTIDGYDAYWRAYARQAQHHPRLRTPRSRPPARLVETADLLAENFTPGVLERLVGGPEALLERNPKLVIVRISGWGQTGPRAGSPGSGPSPRHSRASRI